MSNWCEGKLKIRGTREDIIKFLNAGIQSVDFFGDKLEHKVEVGELHVDTYQSIDLHEWKNHYSYHIKDTRRAFIDFSYIGLYGEEKQIIIGDFKQAWDILANDLVSVAKKFNLDFKIYAFGRGMAFNRDIEIINGEVIKDDVIEFEDYTWECIDPIIGG